MVKQRKLESLPLEGKQSRCYYLSTVYGFQAVQSGAMLLTLSGIHAVIHQIFRYLSPSDLISLRFTCRSISFLATSNHLWQLHCQMLWRSKICLRDCRDVPPSVWAFSLVANGWFRAYSKVREIARSQWLLGAETLDNTIWMVFFKSSLDNANTWPLAWHALVECKDTRIVSAIDGLPLNPSKWYVDERPSFRGMVAESTDQKNLS